MSFDHSLTTEQVFQLLRDLDAMFDDIMERADKAAADNAWQVASCRAMKAHGVLKAMRLLQRTADVDPYVWEASKA